MSRVLVVAEHDGTRLDAATAKCVRCALDLTPDAVVVAVLADGGAEIAAQAARLQGVTEVVLVDAAHNAEPVAAIFAPQLKALASGFTHLLGPSSTFGKDLLPRGESEHLFFVGMFSLLDQLLGIPLDKVVSQLLLPETVVQALLTREGVYGPFLKLVEACEHRDGRVPELADALFVTSTRVNQAHFAALAWAHTVSI